MIITVTQAAKQTGLSRQAIYKAMASGPLPKIDIAGRTFVDTDHLATYVASAKNKGGRPRARLRAQLDS